MGTLKKELASQLHEQYAINNNAYFSSIITLMCCLLVVIGFYGYVFVYTSLKWAENMGSLFINDSFTIDVLLYTTIASYFIIFIIYYICAYQGYQQRKEQFIVNCIRESAGLCVSGEESLFPEGYFPHNKERYDFIQGLYGEFLSVLRVLFTIITILTTCKTYKACNVPVVANDICWCLIVFSATCAILLFFSFCGIVENLYHKYVMLSYSYGHHHIEYKKWSLCCYLCSWLNSSLRKYLNTEWDDNQSEEEPKQQSNRDVKLEEDDIYSANMIRVELELSIKEKSE